jgi:E3 ubiquitin-protein ligase HUWE1
LYHWISLLNRFDDILETFCSTYKLNDGPQAKDFGCELLLGSPSTDEDGDDKWNQAKLAELGYGDDGDSHLIVAILKFTQMLLDHCGNRSIYASSPHLNDLLMSSDWNIICATLDVGVELAQRYQASVKRIGMPSRHLSSALLANHYNIDLDRVQQLSQPFVKTPVFKSSEPLSLSTPTTSTTKGRDKHHGSGPKIATSMYANDLCAIAKPNSTEARWKGWGDVRLLYYPVQDAVPTEHHTLPDRGTSSVPTTPTPLRRSNTGNVPQSTPRSNRQALPDDSPSPSIHPPALTYGDSATPGQKSASVLQSTVVSTPMHKLIERTPSDMPKESKYEFFHRLRVAKALIGTVEERQAALKARLLAIENLAYIHPESVFMEKVLRQDHDEPRRYQLVYQLAELIHPSADGTTEVPVSLQAIALSLLEGILGFSSKVADVFSALNATVNHGVLLYVIRKAVTDMKEDGVGEQWTDEDEWRDNLFSLTLHITMTMATSTTRSTPEIISAGLLEIMVEILTIRSNIAERTHATLVGFLDNLMYNVQSSFQTLINANGLEVITDLIIYQVELAQKLVANGQGTTSDCRSFIVDYEIPFYQQQNLKWLLKFIHHLMSSGFAYGGNTDRLLRNLVDKSALLSSLREIIVKVDLFGSLVWTHAVTILSDFLNNDPISFAAISEAGLVQSFLEAITGRSVDIAQPTVVRSTRNENEDDGPDSPDEDSSSPSPSL